MFENIINFFKKFNKNENKMATNSKDAAKERLHLVLMQDRANVSADFLELMKQEIIDVIKKYIDVDETAIDVRLTNKENGDGTNGAPALYANIPIINIKNEARKVDAKKVDEIEDTKKEKIKENKEIEQETKTEGTKIEETKVQKSEQQKQEKQIVEKGKTEQKENKQNEKKVEAKDREQQKPKKEINNKQEVHKQKANNNQENRQRIETKEAIKSKN